MSARVDFTGLKELISELASAPAETRTEGMAIVRDETEQAARDIAAQLPRQTGTLRSRIRTFYPSSTLLLGIVRSAAPHAHLYEFGTRRRKNKAGANRGVMPAHKVTPIVARTRRARMYRRLADMLRRQGFEVTGDL